ncbi:MAG: glutamate--tRNA ligase [Candidatus Staskawiczbacteria bacterium RIFCSPHIGHO2_02_FULL_34_10]|uniref:Glutamate--tRNA ligase n=2 Tax=Candidatus Staskawicziibacteriota TaxID=1817916 RepID=A0A1G2HKJ4_9BACT|nr:MAG: glutamate--tRNA ligase [Candidatus Staskawiczbacteria bacterium RIFCSPHIGHO2_01_FULL_34_27]OGZ67836.1 MAG: glutamate--tRNA ligase [Candidatus Staskawiczbacteria bacterium RIFCSPHIGHO2_02_FULL_34_10]
MIKKILTKNIRVRFAPSPTGPLHIGGARTALFNYLFANQNNGSFILRIEDTDTQRSELKWVQEIIEELNWLGIEWNEGPDIDGKFGPYKQSQRIDIYKKYLKKLFLENKAYYCFCLPEELEAKRQEQMARGVAPKYDGKCNNISKEIIEKNLAEGKNSVIRFKVVSKKVKFKDLVRDSVEFDTSLLGDIVIAKNMNTPLFHFAVVVDDYLMKISHVIRGEEHLSNTPRQILLQEALGFYHPIYAHIPLFLNSDKSKMSKRQGDVALSDYHKQGYLPEALINFMVLLGWNPGTEKEIFSLSQLVKEFSIEKVQRSGAVFNMQRLDFINNHYIKEKPISALTKLCLPYLKDFDTTGFSKKELEKIIELHKPRMKKISDIFLLCDYFFIDNLTYNKEMLRWQKMGDNDVKEALEAVEKALLKKWPVRITSSAHNASRSDAGWNKENLEKVLMQEAELFNLKKNYPLKNRGFMLWPLRVALSGKQSSAGPFEIAEILGKEETLQRIQDAIGMLS